MWKFLSEHLASPTIAKILGALSPMALAAAIWGRETAIQAAKDLEPQTVAILLTLSVAAILALLAWILYLLPSFRYLPKYQFFQHRISGLYYCPPCRNTKPLSPLSKEISGWRCPFCKGFYKDPDYVAPPPTKKKPRERI